MYNPAGEMLSENFDLPVAEGAFDVICLFSVFTHLAPHDYSLMLKLLRRYIKPGGKLIFSLFVFENTPGGHGFVERRTAGYEISEEDIKNWDGPPDFVDWDPNQPLKWAVYSRESALKLVEGTSWQVESLNYPEPYIQHYMVCSPI